MPKPPNIRPVKKQNNYIHLIITADSGWGKTAFLGTHPRLLFLTCDPEGTVTAKAMESEADEWPCHVFSDMEEAVIWLRDEGCEEYDWVGVDTLSGAQRIIQRNALEKSYAEKPAVRDPDVPGMDVHQKSQIQTIKFIMKVHELPIHSVFTAHPYNLEDGEGEPITLPYVHGGKGDVAQQALGHFNVAGFGVMKEVNGEEVRRLYFTNTGPYKGKDRFIRLGAARDNLTLPQLESIITKPRAAKKVAAKKTARRRPATQ